MCVRVVFHSVWNEDYFLCAFQVTDLNLLLVNYGRKYRETL